MINKEQYKCKTIEIGSHNIICNVLTKPIKAYVEEARAIHNIFSCIDFCDQHNRVSESNTIKYNETRGLDGSAKPRASCVSTNYLSRMAHIVCI